MSKDMAQALDEFRLIVMENPAGMSWKVWEQFSKIFVETGLLAGVDMELRGCMEHCRGQIKSVSMAGTDHMFEMRWVASSFNGKWKMEPGWKTISLDLTPAVFVTENRKVTCVAWGGYTITFHADGNQLDVSSVG